MVKKKNRIITNPDELMLDDEIETIFIKQTIYSTVTKIKNLNIRKHS